MYIQENPAEQERAAPPDYSGHTYVPQPPSTSPLTPDGEREEGVLAAPTSQEGAKEEEKSAPAGAFSGKDSAAFAQKDGRRGDLFGGLGLGNLFSRVPFLSSLAPPPRKCGEGERKHSELWDWVLLGVVALSLLNGRDDDILPLLLLLLLWD